MYFHSFVFFKNSCWSIVDLQCCVSFCRAAKWISYTYAYVAYIYSFSRVFSHIGHYRVLSRVPCAIYGRFLLAIYFILFAFFFYF